MSAASLQQHALNTVMSVGLFVSKLIPACSHRVENSVFSLECFFISHTKIELTCNDMVWISGLHL